MRRRPELRIQLARPVKMVAACAVATCIASDMQGEENDDGQKHPKVSIFMEGHSVRNAPMTATRDGGSAESLDGEDAKSRKEPRLL
jgi:hypothetical protein